MHIAQFKPQAASLLLVSSLIFAGCGAATPAPVNLAAADRESINREMPLVTDYENKRNELKKAIGFLMMNGLFDTETGRQVKEAMAIEYVYYEASIVSLAHGNMHDYRNFVQLAERELNRAKTVLTARVQALQSERAS